MTGIVIDTSALLAYFKGEAGAEIVHAYTVDQVPLHLSLVNLAEASAWFVRNGFEADEPLRYAIALGIQLHDLAPIDAVEIGRMALFTRGVRLSLGDRACLALGFRLNVPVLTADRMWSDALDWTKYQALRMKSPVGMRVIQIR